MAISKNNKLIQVKVSKTVYHYLKKFSEIYGVSLSNFCEDSIVSKILELNRLDDNEINKHALFVKQIYQSGERSN